VWQACNDGAKAVANPDVEPDDIAADVAAALHTRETFDAKGPMTTDELLNLEVPPWLVEGIFPAGLSLLFGAEKTGKSYIALQTAWSYATGTRWFRRKCREEPGQVLYLAGEGVADLKLRVEALVEATDCQPGGLIRWWTEPLSLAKERDAAKLRLAVKECGASLVVVDTWRRFSGLADENDASQVSAALAPLEDLTTQGVSVLVVHHSNAEGGIRGSTALSGAVESAARAIIDPEVGRIALTSYRSRRGVGFQDMELAFKPYARDSVLQETFG
jgi:RecA-family ATPase